MKVLEIKNGKCYFNTDNTSKPISDIGKNDLFKILDMIYSEKDCEIDKIDSNTEIHNDAEKIIYTSIYSKIEDFRSRIQEMKSEVKNEFKEVKEKYAE